MISYLIPHTGRRLYTTMQVTQMHGRLTLGFYTILAVLQSHYFTDVVTNAHGLRLTASIWAIMHNFPAFLWFSWKLDKGESSLCDIMCV